VVGRPHLVDCRAACHDRRLRVVDGHRKRAARPGLTGARDSR
jgi:hypothetical protein